MPHRGWKNRCGCEPLFLSGQPYCSTCGERRESTGWALSMHEAMARYQSLYRLKPSGPHRKMADEALRDLTVSCEACEGVGVLDAPRGFSVCAACRGLGSLLTVPEEVVDAIRARILDRYPEAAAERVVGFPGGPVIQDLRSGAMLGMEVEPREEESG